MTHCRHDTRMWRPRLLHICFACTVCSLVVLLFIGLHVHQNLSKLDIGFTWPPSRVSVELPPPKFEPNQCSHAKCFDVATCAQLHPGFPPNRIRVHVYPVGMASGASREHAELIGAIRTSVYFVETPEVACLLVPDIDLLNGQGSHFDDALRILLSDSRYNNGSNTAIFNILHGENLAHPGMALVVSGDRPMSVYRNDFDITIPFYNPMTARVSISQDLRLAIQVEEARLPELPSVLASYTQAEVNQFQRQIKFIYERYFSSTERIAVTVLDLINDRVFPMFARSYQAWNDEEDTIKRFSIGQALFYPTRMPSCSQFTVLIRAHFYFARLRQLLTRLQYAQGLQRIVVVWTNEDQHQPPAILWPPLRVPLSVIAVENAKKYGRFYPYVQIDTDAVLSLDDYQCPPSLDEVAGAFELWRQNPNSLVGFAGGWSPFQGRNETTLYAFGASFFHKHYLHVYDRLTRGDLLDLGGLLPDSLCEDLLLNALIARLSETGPLVLSSPGEQSPTGSACTRGPEGLCSGRVGNVSHRLTGWWQELIAEQTNSPLTSPAYTVGAVWP